MIFQHPRKSILYFSCLILSLPLLISCTAKSFRVEDPGRPVPPDHPVDRLTVRVLVERGVKRITIEPGSHLMEGQEGVPISGGEFESVITCEGGVLRVNDKEVKGYLRITSPLPFRIDGSFYSKEIILYPAGGGIAIVDVIDIEDYVAAVLVSEVPAGFGEEAKKAVAVAVRTYAVYRKRKAGKEYYDLDSTNLSQVYDGTGNDDSGVLVAVNETEGEIMEYEGVPILAVYHSTCGGRTENSRDLWHRDLPYLRSVSCGFCTASPSYRWKFSIPEEEFLALMGKMGVRGKRVIKVRQGSYTGTGRVRLLVVETELGRWDLDASKVRAALGYSKFKSLKFNVRKRGKDLLIEGSGYGHAVGLCQYGANGMSRKGYGYREILRFYYGEKVDISRIRYN